MFLDIEMPGMSGMDLIKSLEARPMITLTTAATKYFGCIDYNVVDYLVKLVMLPGFFFNFRYQRRDLLHVQNQPTI